MGGKSFTSSSFVGVMLQNEHACFHEIHRDNIRQPNSAL